MSRPRSRKKIEARGGIASCGLLDWVAISSAAGDVSSAVVGCASYAIGGTPFFVIEMVLACVAICLTARAAIIEIDNPK